MTDLGANRHNKRDFTRIFCVIPGATNRHNKRDFRDFFVIFPQKARLGALQCLNGRPRHWKHAQMDARTASVHLRPSQLDLRLINPAISLRSELEGSARSGD